MKCVMEDVAGVGTHKHNPEQLLGSAVVVWFWEQAMQDPSPSPNVVVPNLRLVSKTGIQE